MSQRNTDKWNKIKNEISIIEDEIHIPRWIGIYKTSKIELHGFCDASKVGIGAVIYVRFIEDDKIKVQLLVSKTRVSLLKEVKIPRLELCAADLLSKLTKKVLNAMSIKFQNIYMWSDSKIVLEWINGNPKRWKKFVAKTTTFRRFRQNHA